MNDFLRYVLPDSRTMRVGSERFLAPEILHVSQMVMRVPSDDSGFV